MTDINQVERDLNSQQLIRIIKAHIAKGDKAAEKSEQHYIAAGQHLKALKAEHDAAGGTWAEWEQLLKDKVGIAKSRASELTAIADGRSLVARIPDPDLAEVNAIVGGLPRSLSDIEIELLSDPRCQPDEEDFKAVGGELPARVRGRKRYERRQLSDGRHVPDHVARLVIGYSDVIGVGDTLLTGTLSQTGRFGGEE
jgi:hypothetical protein